MSLRALSEDVQDQAAAIQHLYVQKIFQCPLLLGGKILIRDKQRKSCLLLGLHKLLGLPGANIVCGMGTGSLLDGRSDHLRPCCSGESRYLPERILLRPSSGRPCIDGDKERLLRTSTRHKVNFHQQHPSLSTGDLSEKPLLLCPLVPVALSERYLPKYCTSSHLLLKRHRPCSLQLSRKDTSQEPTGMAILVLRDFFRRTFRHQKTDLITSRLCSITATVLPESTKRCNTSSNLSTSAKCNPVVGSSRMYRVSPVPTLDNSVASLTRCASPPGRVVED